VETICFVLIVAAFCLETNYGSWPRRFPNAAFLFIGSTAVITLAAGGASRSVLAIATLAYIGLGMAIFVLWRYRLRAPPKGDEVVIAFPFVGMWWCAHGGASLGTNYHIRVEAQRHAYDFTGNSLFVRLLLLLRRRNQAFGAYGREILSPVNGTVVAAANDEPDHQPTQRYVRGGQAAGNHLVIQTPEGFLWLSHLQRGSLRHRCGDTVRRGDFVGRCGNSGNSSDPHLHIHMQDDPRLNTGRGIPLAFRAADGRVLRPLRGDRISVRPGGVANKAQ
jgi:hypothetical protein